MVTTDYLTDLYATETPDRITEITAPGVTHEVIIAGRLPEFERNWQVIKRWRPPHRGDRLLDVGCQTGEFGAIAERDGVEPWGVELSHEYAAAAERRWGSVSRVQTQPLTESSFDSGQFSYITAFETLEHMVDPIVALSQMRRWLTADGILAVSVPSADYFVLKTRLLAAMRHRDVGRFVQGIQPGCVVPHTHIYTFSGRSVKVSLERAGLEVLEIDVTGWHGRLNALNRWASLASVLLRGRLLMAPSIRAIARPAAPNNSYLADLASKKRA